MSAAGSPSTYKFAQFIQNFIARTQNKLVNGKFDFAAWSKHERYWWERNNGNHFKLIVCIQRNLRTEYNILSK